MRANAPRAEHIKDAQKIATACLAVQGARAKSFGSGGVERTAVEGQLESSQDVRTAPMDPCRSARARGDGERVVVERKAPELVSSNANAHASQKKGGAHTRIHHRGRVADGADARGASTS